MPEDPLDAWHWQRLALNLLDNAFRDFNNRGYEYQSDYSPDPGVGDRFYDTETGRCGIVVEQAASIDGKSAEWLLRYDDEPCQVERRSDSYRRKSLWLNCCPYAPPAKGSVAKLVEK